MSRRRFVTAYPRSEVMTTLFRELDTVVLLHYLPETGLRKGDLGAVVQVYGAEAVEVEFVTASGRTQALLTLPVSDVRPVRDDDLLAVRTAQPLSEERPNIRPGPDSPRTRERQSSNAFRSWSERVTP